MHGFLFNDHGLLEPLLMLIHERPLPDLGLDHSLVDALDASVPVNRLRLLSQLEPPLRRPVQALLNLQSVLLKQNLIRILRNHALQLLRFKHFVAFAVRKPRVHKILLLLQLHGAFLVDLVHVPKCRVALDYLLGCEPLRHVFTLLQERALRAVQVRHRGRHTRQVYASETAAAATPHLWDGLVFLLEVP